MALTTYANLSNSEKFLGGTYKYILKMKDDKIIIKNYNY